MKLKSLTAVLLFVVIVLGSILYVYAIEGEADQDDYTTTYCSGAHCSYSNDYGCSYYNGCAYYKDYYYSNIRSSTGRLVGTSTHHECNHHVKMQCPKFADDNQCTLPDDPYCY